MLTEQIAQLKQQLSFGVAPAMATPLTEDGYHVNLTVVPVLVDFLITKGVKGLFVGGTTGEGVLLSVEERMKLHQAAMAAANNRVPVLLHVGTNNTLESIMLAEHAAAIGAAAIVAMTPHFYPVHDDALVRFFYDISAAATQLPFFVYDIPQQAINGVTPSLVPQLTAAIPTLAGMKTSRGDAHAVRQLIEVCPEHLIILAGNESVALGMLALGAHGLISGIATAIPEPYIAMGEAMRRGDVAKARHCQLQINQLLKILPTGARIGAIKALLEQRGIPVGPAVPPRPMPIAGWQGWKLAQGILDLGF